jgi:hypothetical protein
MKKINVGDIVIVWSKGVRGIIVNKRDEVVPHNEMWQAPHSYKTRTVYQIAGTELSGRWFEGRELELLSPRNQ